MPNTITFAFLVLKKDLSNSPFDAILNFWAKGFGPNRPWNLNLCKPVQLQCILLMIGLQTLYPIYSYVFICTRLNMDALFQVQVNIHCRFLEINYFFN